MFISVLGLFAGALTTFSLVPQVLQIYKTKETKDLSFNTYFILSIGMFLWLVYGLFIKDFAIISANLISFVLSSTILIWKKKYG